MMQDFAFSDNLWFVQDFPRLPERPAGVKPPKRTPVGKEFERILFGHALALGMPRAYMDDVLSKRFDFGGVRVSLIASTPGITRPDVDDGGEVAIGLLRIKQLVGSEKAIAGIEICSATIGKFDKDADDGAWLNQFWHAVSGGKIDWQRRPDDNSGRGDPPTIMVYPTNKDVSADEIAGVLVLPKSAASQMGAPRRR